ncbi:MAG: hypothetical protein GX448_19090 [Planctomycetes bacterium]|nr:hypothetical protein [Planctomycetota bacterium]
MRLSCFALGVLIVGSSLARADEPALSEPALERALESGCSFFVARIEAVGAEEDKCRFLVKVVRVFVAGDLAKQETNGPLEILAPAAYGNALEAGTCYAMFVRQDAPYGFSWLFRDDAFKIDPADRETVKRLHDLADRVYTRTSMLRFRRGKALAGGELPDLREDLASLCKQFKDHPARRGELGRRIVESDLGSRVDDSKPLSATRVYLPPKTPWNRGQMVALLGYPSWTCGWTCLWCCDERVDSDRGGGEMEVLSATFDPNERAVCVVYEMQERSKWVGSIGFPRDAEGGDAARVARSFQEALRRSDWGKALSLCSQRVKAETPGADSAEAFFRRFVPVEQIASFGGRRPGEFSSGSGHATRVSCRVEIPVPGQQWSVGWPWTLVRVGQVWAVDFEPIALDTFIRKELLKREFMDRPVRMKPEKFSRAVEFRLSPIDYEFVIGAPMRFRVEMKNVGDDPIPYRWSSAVMTGDPMLVTDPEGETVPYVDAPYQISVVWDAILPGETVVFADSYDVTTQYRIVRPGRYRFQFRGWPRDSELSNVCEVEVKPGILSDAERISERLLGVMPAGWQFERMLSLPHGEEDAPGAGGRFFNLIGRRDGKGGDAGVFLVLLKETEPADADPWLKEHYDLWGLCPCGLVYARVNEAAQLWPSHRAQLERALEIKPPPGQ